MVLGAGGDMSQIDPPYLLMDREHGRGLGITLYETEEDLQRGNEALNQMTPPAQGGRRTDVALYEVALHKQR
jgi:hypothetical protein